MGERIPLKKDRNRWGRRALMVRIIAKVKNSKKLFLIVYFHKYLSNLINTNNYRKETEGKKIGTKKREFSHEVFGGRGVR